MTDHLAARVDQVKAIIEPVDGRLVERNRDALVIELPADAAIWLHSEWGMKGFRPIKRNETVEREVSRDFRDGRRIPLDAPKPMTFYIYDLDLNPPPQPAQAPTPADITRQTPPHRREGH
jgi:hypothetical protein